MPDETEPTSTPPVPANDAEHPSPDTERAATESRGARVPKWLAVGAVAVALAGGGFAIGRATTSDHRGGLVPIGDSRLSGGPGGDRGLGGGPGGGSGGGNRGPDIGGGANGSSNAPTTPSTTPDTIGSTGT